MKPVHLDGLIYVLIAFFGSWTALLGSDEAAKFISDTPLFWSRGTCTSLGAAMLALKMYRSTAYSDWRKEQNGHGSQKTIETAPSEGSKEPPVK